MAERRVRSYLDQHVEPAIAEGLRQRGIDAVGTAEAGNCGYTDEEQLEYAVRRGRVVVTHDHDFLDWHGEGTAHAGIVYGRQGKLSLGEIVRFLKLHHDVATAEAIRIRVEFL